MKDDDEILVSARLRRSLHASATRIADAQDRSIASIIRLAIAEWVERQGGVR